MVNPLMSIEVAGEKRAVLFTPSLYTICKERNWTIEVDSNSDILQIRAAYCKLIYAAAVNYYQIKKFDDPNLKDFDLTLVDIEIWATLHPKECTQMILDGFYCLQGETIEQAAKKVQKSEEVKKKSALSGITNRLKRFWSGKGLRKDRRQR